MVRNRNQTFLVGALIGCAVGAVAGLLFTPTSGPKIRKRILNGVNHINRKARQGAARLQQNGAHPYRRPTLKRSKKARSTGRSAHSHRHSAH